MIGRSIALKMPATHRIMNSVQLSRLLIFCTCTAALPCLVYLLLKNEWGLRRQAKAPVSLVQNHADQKPTRSDTPM